MIYLRGGLTKRANPRRSCVNQLDKQVRHIPHGCERLEGHNEVRTIYEQARSKKQAECGGLLDGAMDVSGCSVRVPVELVASYSIYSGGQPYYRCKASKIASVTVLRKDM